MRRDAKACGLNHGWTQSSRDSSGAVGVLTLARSFGAIKPAEVRMKSPAVIWLAHAAHAGLSRHWVATQVAALHEKISAREREILHWMAEGKTAGEVAAIVGITERTVAFHVERLIAKLGAVNKTQAVVRAIRLGLV
jgi:DNA-binding CsgD family transcriptional regulator